MTLEEGHWILVFERSIVQDKGKAQAPLAKKKKKKNLTPDCLSIVNQMECLCFMTQRTIEHFRWNMIWKSILFIIFTHRTASEILYLFVR